MLSADDLARLSGSMTAQQRATAQAKGLNCTPLASRPPWSPVPDRHNGARIDGPITIVNPLTGVAFTLSVSADGKLIATQGNAAPVTIAPTA